MGNACSEESAVVGALNVDVNHRGIGGVLDGNNGKKKNKKERGEKKGAGVVVGGGIDGGMTIEDINQRRAIHLNQTGFGWLIGDIFEDHYPIIDRKYGGARGKQYDINMYDRIQIVYRIATLYDRMYACMHTYACCFLACFYNT